MIRGMNLGVVGLIALLLVPVSDCVDFWPIYDALGGNFGNQKNGHVMS
jgi:hypothetical protein